MRSDTWCRNHAYLSENGRREIGKSDDQVDGSRRRPVDGRRSIDALNGHPGNGSDRVQTRCLGRRKRRRVVDDDRHRDVWAVGLANFMADWTLRMTSYDVMTSCKTGKPFGSRRTRGILPCRENDAPRRRCPWSPVAASTACACYKPETVGLCFQILEVASTERFAGAGSSPLVI